MMVRLHYFAWVREMIGLTEEVVDLPAAITTPRAAMLWLASRGDGFARAFAEPEKLRCAVDQHMIGLDAVFGNPDEIAFFPPVTGG